MRHLLVKVAMLILICCGTGFAVACPLCKDAIQSSDSVSAVPLLAGYSKSVLAMLCVPFVLGVGFAMQMRMR